MNERVIEIFKKSRGRLSFDENSSPYQFEQEELEKFVNLIVRECARIADRKYLYSKEPNRWDSGFNISCEILKQFGILKNE